MKRIGIALVLSLAVIGMSAAQEDESADSINVYTFFVNVVTERFRLPLLGFVNIAGGSHNLPQIGFVNWNGQDFRSLQLGFVNTVGGDVGGFQMGFVNTIIGGMTGLQLGFVNTTVRQFNGAQISFVNITKQLSGLQFGFVNYSDTIEKGMPIGFLSIVKNGGYRAVEFGVSEIAPFNLSFKIGVERLYTSFLFGYNQFRDGIREQIVVGAGLGSIIPAGKGFYVNPEITINNGINEAIQHYVIFTPSVGYTITPNLSVTCGPSIVWAYNNTDGEPPFFYIAKEAINDEHILYIGARAALRFRW